ncbi:hypothetical protein C8J57DRAFT_1718096 [Mycena rebaudengoi]|nr:hypothetical protein C8J57DRAFT_1718096 [Mycena rebaudengoi]
MALLVLDVASNLFCWRRDSLCPVGMLCHRQPVFERTGAATHVCRPQETSTAVTSTLRAGYRAAVCSTRLTFCDQAHTILHRKVSAAAYERLPKCFATALSPDQQGFECLEIEIAGVSTSYRATSPANGAPNEHAARKQIRSGTTSPSTRSGFPGGLLRAIERSQSAWLGASTTRAAYGIWVPSEIAVYSSSLRASRAGWVGARASGDDDMLGCPKRTKTRSTRRALQCRHLLPPLLVHPSCPVSCMTALRRLVFAPRAAREHSSLLLWRGPV